MSSSKLIRLGTKTGSSDNWDLRELCQHVIDQIDAGEVIATKGVIVALNTGEDDDEWNFGWFQAGMRMSQCYALMGCAQHSFLNSMGIQDD